MILYNLDNRKFILQHFKSPPKHLQINVISPSKPLQKIWSPSKRLHFCVGKVVVKSNGVGRYSFYELSLVTDQMQVCERKGTIRKTESLINSMWTESDCKIRMFNA